MNSLTQYTLEKTITKQMAEKADFVDFEAFTDSTLTYNENKQILQEEYHIPQEITPKEAKAQEIAFNLAEKQQLEERMTEINQFLEKEGIHQTKPQSFDLKERSTPPSEVKSNKEIISNLKRLISNDKMREIEENYNLKCEGWDNFGYPILKVVKTKGQWGKVIKVRPINYEYAGKRGKELSETEKEFNLFFLGWESDGIEVFV